jgi:hypothetical protein
MPEQLLYPAPELQAGACGTNFPTTELIYNGTENQKKTYSGAREAFIHNFSLAKDR